MTTPIRRTQAREAHATVDEFMRAIAAYEEGRRRNKGFAHSAERLARGDGCRHGRPQPQAQQVGRDRGQRAK